MTSPEMLCAMTWVHGTKKQLLQMDKCRRNWVDHNHWQGAFNTSTVTPIAHMETVLRKK